ncbi:DNA recombination/repair protein RecA [Patescibacteria group bacterium]|nr:DNA recombination/repair protein RecA [Patescibacteria group bacterium]
MTEPLNNIIKDISKNHPDVALLGNEGSPCVVSEWMSTGVFPLDAILGGGLPVGRITEIYGDTSTGKSLLAAQVVALAQEDGHTCMMVDTETAVSLPIMEAVGVDIDKLIYASPDTVEEVFELFDDAIEAKEKHNPESILLLIWDSIAATSASAEMDNEYGKATMAQHARLISHGLRKITRKISKGRVCALFLNQTRQKIGVMYGDKVATFGGKAVGFHSSIRVQLKLGQKIKTSRGIVGIEARALVVKNKVAMPFRSADLPIYFGHGVDNALASLYYLKKAGEIITAGGWSTISINGEEVRFQKKGWDKVFDEHFDAIANMILGD